MSETAASLRHKIASAGELGIRGAHHEGHGRVEHRPIRECRALARRLLSDGATGPGRQYCLRQEQPAAPAGRRMHQETNAVGAIVFGSDQGLVGQFNEVMVEFVVDTLGKLPGKKTVWAVGERIQSRLEETDLSPLAGFTLPNSISAITPLVGQTIGRNGIPPRKGRGHTGLCFSQPAPIRGNLFTCQPAIAAAGRPLATRSCRDPVADRQPSRGFWRERENIACAGTRVSFCFAFQRLRRVACERECQPPGRNATRREEYRRIAGGSEPVVPSFAPERNRRGIVRRHLRV